MTPFLKVPAGSHFTIHNIPFGVCLMPDGHNRCCTRLGDFVFDLHEIEQLGFFDSLGLSNPRPFAEAVLNSFLSLPHAERREVRAAIQELLSSDSPHKSALDKIAVPIDRVQPQLPARIGDYTDFYASRWHASNVGKMFRPDSEPLLPNWLHLPVGYHGRSSSIVPSGIPVRRPRGQIVPQGASSPIDAASRLLDYELEIGAFYGGPASELGSRIPLGEAGRRLAGLVIVNDWSARDIQKWEYQPLGPFNSKNFQTSISPWIVTLDALEPFRVPLPKRSSEDPDLLDYLQPQGNQGFDITVEVYLQSAEMNEPALVSAGNFREMWWSFEQMLAHHSSTGCPFNPGDLLASGTISGESPDSRGCLLERTWRGTEPLKLPDGSERTFLKDGDTVVMTAFCRRQELFLGFGEVRATVLG